MYIPSDSIFKDILENRKANLKWLEMVFNEKLNLSQNCSVHGVYQDNNWAMMQLESVKMFSRRKASVQWLFNQSEKGMMGVEALKITNRNMTMEVTNHYHKLQGKQWNSHLWIFSKGYKNVKGMF